MSLKSYLEGMLSKYVTLMKHHLANLKICPVQLNGMEGSYECEEFHLSPKNSVIPVNDGRDVS